MTPEKNRSVPPISETSQKFLLPRCYHSHPLFVHRISAMPDLPDNWRPLHERLDPDDRVAPPPWEPRPLQLPVGVPGRRSPTRSVEAPDPPLARRERIRAAERVTRTEWAAGTIELRGCNAAGRIEDVGRLVPVSERLSGCTLLLALDRVRDRTRNRVWTGVEWRVVVPAAREEAQEPPAGVDEPAAALEAPSGAPEKTGKGKGGRTTRRNVIRSTFEGLTANDRAALAKLQYKKQRRRWLAEKIARETKDADGLGDDAIRNALKRPPALML
jgi:hypothetical protein